MDGRPNRSSKAIFSSSGDVWKGLNNNQVSLEVFLTKKGGTVAPILCFLRKPERT